MLFSLAQGAEEMRKREREREKLTFCRRTRRREREGGSYSAKRGSDRGT